MAGERGRDLKVGILSDTEKFDLSKPANEFEDLGRAAKRSGEDLDSATDDMDKAKDELKRLAKQGEDARKELERLNREVKDNELDRFGRDAKDTAKKVDSAFDAIAKSSKSNFKKVEDDLGDVEDRTAEVKDEARSNLSEVASSFQGDMTSAVDLLQGTLGGLATMLGPAGIVAAAAAVGVGAIAGFFGKSKEKAEEAKAAVEDWVQAFIDGQGKIQAATIEGKLNELLGDPERFKEISQQAKDAGVSIVTYARALSGSTDDQKKLSDQLQVSSRRVAEAIPSNGQMTSTLVRQRAAIEDVAKELGVTTGQMGTAKKAWEVLDEATRAGITANVDVKAPTAKELANEHAQMKGELGKQIDVPVKVDALRAAQIGWLEADRYYRNHPITIRTKGPTGQRPVRDVP